MLNVNQAECGTCGGSGCSSRNGLTGEECCTANIKAAGVACGEPPCIVTGRWPRLAGYQCPDAQTPLTDLLLVWFLLGCVNILMSSFPYSLVIFFFADTFTDDADADGGSPTPTPPSPSSLSYSYAGCFVDDSSDRVLTGDSMLSSNSVMTAAVRTFAARFLWALVLQYT